MFSHKEHRLLLPVSHVQSMSQTFLSLCPFVHPLQLITLPLSVVLLGRQGTIVIWTRSSVVFCLGFPGGSDGKESACNAGDLGLTPGLGRSPGERMSTHFSILAWKIPWTEEPGGLWSMGSQRVRYDRAHGTSRR